MRTALHNGLDRNEAARAADAGAVSRVAQLEA
jgi:hypothetical protein